MQSNAKLSDSILNTKSIGYRMRYWVRGDEFFFFLWLGAEGFDKVTHQCKAT